MHMELIQHLALAGGLSWASGLRLYLTVFAVGLLAKFGYIDLPTALDILSNPVVIGVSGILAAIEFLADKIPYVDSAWDSIQSFIRIPAGALLAITAIWWIPFFPVWSLIYIILGMVVVYAAAEHGGRNNVR